MVSKINLKKIASLPNAVWSSQPPRKITGVSIDSRSCKEGHLFVALPGENTDGHRYVQAAIENGAIAAVVEEKQDVDLPQLIVENAEVALQEMARNQRELIDSYVVAITGSCGKTTLKEMLSSLLQTKYSVGKTPGNYNNQLGLPLTVLNQGGRELLVAEVGTNAPGEIKFLTEILKPDLGIITHIGAAHLQRLKDVDSVAAEKSALLAGLKRGGIAYIPDWIDKKDILINASNTEVRLVGSKPGSAFFVDWKLNCSGSRLLTEQGSLRVPFVRRELLCSSALALAVGSLLGIENDVIEEQLAEFKTPAGRGRIIEVENCQLIDGSYNANPDSMAAALSHFEQMPTPQLIVVGEMKELGEQAAKLHRELGERLACFDAAEIHYVGNFSEEVKKGFGSGKVFLHENVEEIMDLSLRDFAVALVKSSHAVGLHKLVKKWTDSL